MKAFKWIIIFASLFQFSGAFAQNYSDGIESLMEIKFASEDIARAVKLEWNHDAQHYLDARNKYNAVKRSIDQMIAAFDAQIKSGKKVSNDDIERYVGKATTNFEALADHYNTYSSAGGTNGLFGIDKLVPLVLEIFKGVTNAVDLVEDYLIQKRLNKMHEALDPCKLVAWENI